MKQNGGYEEHAFKIKHKLNENTHFAAKDLNGLDRFSLFLKKNINCSLLVYYYLLYWQFFIKN